MKNFMGPFSTRARDKRVNALIRQGSATHDELFEAQFGEWPIKGLSKDTPRDEVIQFKGFLKDKRYNPLKHIFRLGYARSSEKEEDEIFLNGLVLSPVGPVFGLLATRLAFARAHDVLKLMLPLGAVPVVEPIILATALMSSYRYAIVSSFVKLLATSTTDVVGEEQIHLFHAKEPTGSIASSAFKSVAHDWFENQDGLQKAKITISQAIDMIFTLMPIGYYAADAELQARLHNIMVRGYPAWGKIPEDTDELYAALMDMGIKTPTDVGRYYRAPENNDLIGEFNKHSWLEQGYFSPPSAEMNIGLNSYRDGQLLGFKTGDILNMYWQDCLPYLFSGLHKNYGDSKGLEKFGYSDELDMAGMPMKLEPKFK